MEPNQPLRFFNRGPSPAVRLAFFALLSLLLLFVDVRYRYLESLRNGLSVLVYPLQRLVTAPSKLWHEVEAFVVFHSSLVHDNAELRKQHTLDIVQLLQLEVLKSENKHLRDLLTVKQRAEYPMQLAEIMYAERDIFNRKVLLDKGTQADVLAGQIVMDDKGIVGQVTRVYPWMSEVTLITDKGHAVPVQVLRNGLRAVVFGSGDAGELALRYIPNSSEIKKDDVLVTSGIDGTYPPGLPVAKVIHVERDPAYPFARILCAPIGGVDKWRQLLILSELSKLPERPEVIEEAATDTPKNGKRGGR